MEEVMISYNRTLERELQEKRKSLLNAQKIQQNLNTRRISVTENLDCAAFYLPSEELGGDFFMIQKFEDRIFLILGDCEGHGLEAALDSVLAKSICDRYVNVLEIDRTDIFLETVNQDMIRYFGGEKFMTLLAAVFHIETGRVFYSSANAETPLLIRRGRGDFLPRPEGWHIGFDPKAAYEQQCFQMEEGDTLLFFSDALREGCVINGEEPGTAAVLNLAAQLGRGNAKDLEFIRHSVKNQSRGLRLDDDLTLCLFQMRGSGYREGVFYTHADAGLFEEEVLDLMAERSFSFAVQNQFKAQFQDFLRQYPKTGFEAKIFINFQVVQITLLPRGVSESCQFEFKEKFRDSVFASTVF
jgi:serine phosphatase RsbU (regulator of sigma subunit)